MSKPIDDQVKALGAKLLLLRTANELRRMGLEIGPDVPGDYVLIEDDGRELKNESQMRSFGRRTGFLWVPPKRKPR
jgi:hypothetical protein